MEFLAIPDKVSLNFFFVIYHYYYRLSHDNDFSIVQNVVELRDRYGGDAYPRPREDDIDSLVASGLMNVQSQVIQRDSVQLEEISRENVMQGPLVKVCKLN